MFLDKLQSGFLLFQTPQGLVRVDLSLQERIYLLWTFRNFRRLSTPLLNSRQRALVNALFRSNAGAISHSHDPSLVIGMVENFAPPAVQKVVQKEERQEKIAAAPAGITPKRSLLPSSAPTVVWPRLATTLSVLSLCIISVAAWHRIQGIPASQALNQPRLRQINSIAVPNSSQFQKPADLAEYPIARSTTTTPPLTVPKAAVEPSSIAAVVQTSKQRIRLPKADPTPNLPLSGQESFIHVSRPPERFVYPVYAGLRTRGVVALIARVDSDGAVRTVRVVSGNRALSAAAVRAVRQWHYRPYLIDSLPIATETNIVISFISDDAISMSFPPSIPPSGAEMQSAKHNLSEKLKMR